MKESTPRRFPSKSLSTKVIGLPHEEAKKLETVRLALRNGDLAEAAKYGRIFELHPVS